MNKFEELVRFMRTQTNARMYVLAPEDKEILELCLKHGFGAVIDSAARQWQKRDPLGAVVVGPPRVSMEILFNPKPRVSKNRKKGQR